MPARIILVVASTLAALAALSWVPPGAAAAAEPAPEELWDALRQGGVYVLLRHAIAPGYDDPPGFRVDACATQRNLSAEGRAQARQIGTALRRAGVAVSAVRSNQWCRCLETARLLGVGPVLPWPALNSLHGRPEREAEQTAALRSVVGTAPAQGVVVLVTHQATIRALTGAAPGSGEMVVVQPAGAGRFRVLGRIPTH